MYEVMRYWDTAPTGEEEPRVVADYAAIWQAADKIVYSSTLEDAPTARTKLERRFAPDAVRALKHANDIDLTIGGPGRAPNAPLARGLHEIHPVVVPPIGGGGTGFLPEDLRMDLKLFDERRFPNGTVYLAYRVVA